MTKQPTARATKRGKLSTPRFRNPREALGHTAGLLRQAVPPSC